MSSKYKVIYSDPPWSFTTYSEKGKGRSAEAHYDCMSLDDIKALPIVDFADDDCVLFMWVTDSMLEKGLEVIKAWGFTFKTVAFTWAKIKDDAFCNPWLDESWFMGLGYWSRANPEQCLLATRGKPSPHSHKVRQLVISPRREHSRKPDEVYDRIETLCVGPYLELFSRNKRDGWDCLGDEVELGVGERRWKSNSFPSEENQHFNRIKTNDKEICKAYLNGQNTREIGKIHNVGQGVIINRLRSNGITLRNVGHKRIDDNLNDEQLEIINGELLGDGSIVMGKAYKNARFEWGGKSRSHGEYLHKILDIFASCFCPDREYWKISSKAAMTFTNLHEIWYPNGEKLVPPNINITPTSLLHWYIGDGCLRVRENRSPYVFLSTQCFTMESLEILIKELEKFDLHPKPEKNAPGFVLRFSTDETENFFSIIGECPFVDYLHRWNRFGKNTKTQDGSQQQEPKEEPKPIDIFSFTQ